MNPAALKLVFGVVIAAIFFGCILLSIEGGINFLHISVGFFVVVITAFVLSNLRMPVLYAVAAFFAMVAIYASYKLHWSGAAYGAAAGLLVAMLIQIGWVQPHVRDSFVRENYAKEQERIHQGEKEGRAAGGPGVPGQS